jgi:hypothetical protein
MAEQSDNFLLPLSLAWCFSAWLTPVIIVIIAESVLPAQRP